MIRRLSRARRSRRSTRCCRVAPAATPRPGRPCAGILEDVLDRGDEAVREYGRRFDGVDLAPAEWELDPADLAGRAEPDRARRCAQALGRAVDRVREYHEHQREPGFHLTRGRTAAWWA